MAFLQANPDYRVSNFSSHWVTRAITANIDGSSLFAHFIWRGDNALCAWANPEDSDRPAFYLFFDRSKRFEMAGESAFPTPQKNHPFYCQRNEHAQPEPRSGNAKPIDIIQKIHYHEKELT